MGTGSGDGKPGDNFDPKLSLQEQLLKAEVELRRAQTLQATEQAKLAAVERKLKYLEYHHLRSFADDIKKVDPGSQTVAAILMAARIAQAELHEYQAHSKLSARAAKSELREHVRSEAPVPSSGNTGVTAFNPPKIRKLKVPK